MGRCVTIINLLTFSVPILSQKSYSRKVAHWAKCLQLRVGQVVSECTLRMQDVTALIFKVTLYG